MKLKHYPWLVKVDADPLHIHISPTVFDASLVEFLKNHPITKELVLFIFYLFFFRVPVSK